MRAVENNELTFCLMVALVVLAVFFREEAVRVVSHIAGFAGWFIAQVIDRFADAARSIVGA